MRQLTRTDIGRLDWVEVPAPSLREPTDALVRPMVVTLCDVDRPMVDGRLPVPGEIGLGHECVAVVVEVGESVATVRPGDRVVVPFQLLPCGQRIQNPTTYTLKRPALASKGRFALRPYHPSARSIHQPAVLP